MMIAAECREAGSRCFCWRETPNVEPIFIERGCPQQNHYAERVNHTMRDELLGATTIGQTRGPGSNNGLKPGENADTGTTCEPRFQPGPPD